MTPDYSKMFDPSETMKNFNMDKWINAQRRSVEACQTATTTMTKAMNGVMSRQMEIYQSAMEDGAEMMRSLSTAKGMEDYMSRQNSWMQKCTDKAMRSSQEVMELIRSAGAEAAEVCTKCAMDTAKSMTDANGASTSSSTSKSRK